MIDTIEIHLHDLDRHYDIVKAIDPHITRNGVTRKLVERPHEEESDFYQKLSMKPVVNMHNLGQEIYLASWTNLQSNHKNVATMIDWKRKLIRFNLSIPKFLYGNNIQMFIPNPWDRNFKGYGEDAMKFFSVDMYGPLVKFIRTFFDRMFPNYHVDYDCVFLNRIDLCYNQVFNSKKEALEYLAWQKKSQRKHSREIVKEKRNYEFGITFVSPGYYSEKIYHKGTEYSSKLGDRGWHVEKNRLLKKQVYDVDAYQELADKILRYEFTFHSRGMDMFFKDKVFRRNDKVWRNLKDDIKLLAHFRNETGNLFNPDKDKKAYTGLRERDSKTGKRTGNFVQFQNFSTQMKKKIKYFRAVEGRKLHFFIGEPDTVEDNQYFLQWDLSPDIRNIRTTKRLSNRFMQVLGMRFLLFVYSYRVKGLNNFTTIIEKLRKLKKEQNYARSYYVSKDIYIKHISERQLRIILEMMVTMSLVDMKDGNVISKRSYYRFVKFFKENGYDENTRYGRTVENSYDFQDYYNWLIKNRSNLYFGKNFSLY